MVWSAWGMVALASTSVHFAQQQISEPVEDSQLFGFTVCLDIHNRKARTNMAIWFNASFGQV